MRCLTIITATIVSVGMLACSKSRPTSTQPETESKPAREAISAQLAETIAIRDGTGAVAFSVVPTQEGVDLQRGSGAPVASYSLGVKTRVRRVKGSQVVAVVVGDPDQVQLKSEGRLRAVLKQTGDGYTLEMGGMVLRLEQRNAALDAKDASGTKLFVVKVKGARTVLRNAGGETIYATRKRVDLVAMACLAINGLSFEEKVGMFLHLQVRSQGA